MATDSAPIVAPDVRSFAPTAASMLRHYASGEYPCFLQDDVHGPVGWVRYSHRGIHLLDKIHIGKKQKRDVFNESFEVRFDTAFDDVLASCADLTRDGFTWITPGLRRGFSQLHRMGYAHSFECWQEGRLVGGSFGLQLGSLVTIESMFHTVDNASKAAYCRTLLHLKDRGFKLADVNDATEFFVRYGAETVRQWKFEELLRDALRDRPTLTDRHTFKPLPLGVRIALPIRRVIGAVRRRIAKESEETRS